jgi:predicted permease
MNYLFDLSYAIRVLLKRPGFTALAVVVLAVATALSLFMLAFINTLVFKALPFRDGEDIVIIDALRDDIMTNGGHLHPLDLEQIRQSVNGLEEFVTQQERYSIVSGRDSARSYQTSRTEAHMFNLTRTEPMLGRVFTEAEVRSGGETVVVISHDVWQSYFGGIGNIIDQVVRVDGEPARVIGVMPPGFRFPYSTDMWMPSRLDLDRVSRGDGVNALALARLADGISLDEVQAEAHLVMRRLSEAYPETNERISAYVTTIPMSSMGQGMLFVIASMVAAVLLVVLAAVNVGNLLLSHALERNKETAIRLALGAPRLRLVIQMMGESAAIILVGAGAGLLIAAWSLEETNAITARFIDEPPLFWWNFGLDRFVWSVFAWIILGMLLLAGFIPAIRAARRDFMSALRDGARGAVSRKDGRLSHKLVIIECLLSVAILIAASVLVVNSYMAVRTDYGVQMDNLFTARINLPGGSYSEADQQTRFAMDLKRSLLGKGGVRGVAIMSSLPGTGGWNPTYEVEGFEYRDAALLPRGTLSSVVPESMSVLGIELLEGRFFDSRDVADGLNTVIVSEAAARKHWPDESPLGRRLRVKDNNLPDGYTDRGDWRTVIGVVRQTIHGQPFGSVDDATTLYVPFGQQPNSHMYVAFTWSGEATGAMRTLDAALALVDADVPAFSPMSYAERAQINVAAMAFISQLFLLFGVVAVMLAGSGIYGVMSNSIARRTQEIGVKRALGASDSRVLRDFFSSALRRLMFGIVPGTLVGGAFGWMAVSLLDMNIIILALIVTVMPLLLTAIILLATWVPTRRALALEPSEALRHD